eukprot:XP_001709454.1 Hypothetical protein GL50803_113866 [Giardia lamblia ATCC 50803]
MYHLQIICANGKVKRGMTFAIARFGHTKIGKNILIILDNYGLKPLCKSCLCVPFC